MLGKSHLAVGVLGLVLFVLQGQYMDQVHDHLAGMDDAPRMLFRSSHIYLLLVSVANLVAGVYMTDSGHGVPAIVRVPVSAALLLAPVGLIAGFFLEPAMDELLRPYTRPALYALFVAGVLLAFTGVAKLLNR